MKRALIAAFLTASLQAQVVPKRTPPPNPWAAMSALQKGDADPPKFTPPATLPEKPEYGVSANLLRQTLGSKAENETERPNEETRDLRVLAGPHRMITILFTFRIGKRLLFRRK